MTLLKKFEQFGVEYIFSKLDLLTAPGRNKLHRTDMSCDVAEIERRLMVAEDFFRMLRNHPQNFGKLRNTVSRCRDISATLRRLSCGETLDEIELFEIKELAFLSRDIALLLNASMERYRPADLSGVIEILDPDGANIPSFYIYDSYNDKLSKLRLQHKLCVDSEKKIQLACSIIQEEQLILCHLSKALAKYSSDLCDALDCMALIDYETAKGLLSDQLGLTKPRVASNGIKLKEAFNVEVRDALHAKSREFQPVDIELREGVCLLTGANMTGKSVILKTLAITQVLFQSGFFVPAAAAEIQPVDEMFFLSGDLQSVGGGLSSYAAEILYADNAVQKSFAHKTLVLLDELARSTNPHEGCALVSAVVKMLAKTRATALVTTHYSAVNAAVRRMKVKGIRDVEIPENVDISMLGNYIDYTVVEDDEANPPEEALRIAELIGVSANIIKIAREQL